MTLFLCPIDAVLSVSGHLSTVRAVEPVTVPVSEGLRPELPLLVNQEGEDNSLPDHNNKPRYNGALGSARDFV